MNTTDRNTGNVEMTLGGSNKITRIGVETSLAAVTSDTICTTCGRRANAPYRRFDALGYVIEGCVTLMHEAHLVPLSESRRWAIAARKRNRKLTLDRLGCAYTEAGAR